MTPALLYSTCRPPNGGGDRLDHLVAVDHVGHDHLGTLRREQLGADATETRCCTCDEGHSAFETIHGADGSRPARLTA
jgi:hypothetical protein